MLCFFTGGDKQLMKVLVLVRLSSHRFILPIWFWQASLQATYAAYAAVATDRLTFQKVGVASIYLGLCGQLMPK